MNAEATIRLYGGRVLRDHQLQSEELWIRAGRVISPQAEADQSVDASGALIVPGYIDIQINGGFGVDLSSQPERLPELAAQLPIFGVTAFLPTVITSPRDSYSALIAALRTAPQGPGAQPLGLHLEGPCLSPQRSGCHPKQHLSPLLPELGPDAEGIALITLAPEYTGLNSVRDLVERGVRVAAGHSMASYQEMQDAEQAGLSLVTHLGNATRPFDQREPGIYAAALLSEQLYASVIADGVHLHPATLQLFIKLLGERLILVSDAMPALGLADGKYRFGAVDIELEGHRAFVSGTRQLAGSACPLDACVRQLVAAGSSVVSALEAASLRPATYLGLAPRKGCLEIGADADFLLLDNELNVKECWIAGKPYDGA